MVVSCPVCAARLRLARERLAGKRVTLRCIRCRGVFKVEVPLAAAENTRYHVLVAHGDRALCSTIGDILAAAGISYQVCHDGEDALASMAAAPPQVAVVDVALPGLYAFEVVDKVRSRPGLGEVKILLLSSVYNKTAYKRTPSSLYGADDYIEKHHLPDDLVPKIHRLAVSASPVSAAVSPKEPVAVGQAMGGEESGPQMRTFVDAVNARIRDAEESEVSPPAGGDGFSKARRLAHIIVSDIALYNQERVEEGIRQGNVFDLLAEDLEEGRRFFNERIPPEIGGQENFLHQAFSTLVEQLKRDLRL